MAQDQNGGAPATLWTRVYDVFKEGDQDTSLESTLTTRSSLRKFSLPLNANASGMQMSPSTTSDKFLPISENSSPSSDGWEPSNHQTVSRKRGHLPDVWKAYLEEAERHDSHMLQRLERTLNGVLIFAGLLSIIAIVLAERTITALRPDHTVALLEELSLLMRTGGSIPSMQAIPPTNQAIAAFSPSSTDIWINGTLFVTLSLSLCTALSAILVRQWLVAYGSGIIGNTLAKSLLRQLRFGGLMKWKVVEIINFLPILLQIALTFFLVALVLHVSTFHTPLAIALLAICGTFVMSHIVTAIMPVFWIDNPYRISVLPCVFGAVLYPVKIILFWVKRLTQVFLGDGYRRLHQDSPGRPGIDLHAQELSFVDANRNRTSLAADSLSWLFDSTTNRSVLRLAFHSSVDHLLQGQRESRDYLLAVAERLPLSSMISYACDMLFTSPEPADADQLESFLCSIVLSSGHPYSGDNLPSGVVTRAIEYGRIDFLKCCIGSGLPVNTRLDDCDKMPMIGLAAQRGHADLVKLFINSGAEIDTPWYGLTPLCLATAEGKLDLMEILLQRGAAVMGSTSRSNLPTPLHIASSRGEVASVQLLLSYKADITLPDHEGNTSLHKACLNGHLDVVKLLLNNSSGDLIVTRRNDRGESPLHVLCKGGGIRDHAPMQDRIGIAQLLCAFPGAINAQDKEGKTPLHQASQRRFLPLVDFLWEQGAVTTPNDVVSVHFGRSSS